MFGITLNEIGGATIIYIIVHGIVKFLYLVLHNGERSAAILLHYQHQASGKGHEADSVLGCSDGHCAIFDSGIAVIA